MKATSRASAILNWLPREDQAMTSVGAKHRPVRSELLKGRVMAAFRSRQLCIDEGSTYSFGGSFAPDRTSAVLTDLAVSFGVLRSSAPGGELQAQEIFNGLCASAAELLGPNSTSNPASLSKHAKALYNDRIASISSLFEWQDFLEEHFLPKTAKHELSDEQAELRRAIAFIFALDAELFRASLLVTLGYDLNLAEQMEEREQHAYLICYKYGYVNSVELGLEHDSQLSLAPAKPITLAKRLFDLGSVSLIMLLTSPLFIAIALIQAFDNGPLFYGQRRIGHGGSIFRCWKFRTMIPNAEAVLEDILERDPAAKMEWAQYEKLRDDPRITRIGKFLRRTSLDELPQLFNVINGDMSLVGPRPMAVHERDRWGAYYRLYKQVKPGITGPWQIQYRTDSDYGTRIRCLNEYVDNWSLVKDIKYLLLTLKVPFAKTGAY